MKTLLALSVSTASAEIPCRFPITPTIADPGHDVSKLHPAHVSVIAAFGDSVTAAVGADDVSPKPLEYRTRSWSGGKGSGEFLTMPYVMSKYQQQGSGGIFGPASLKYPRPAYMFNWPFPYDVIGENAHLNIALSGAVSNTTRGMEFDEFDRRITTHFREQIRLNTATKRLRFQSDLDLAEEKQKAQALMDDSWKVVTVFMGENDICESLKPCGNATEQQEVIDNYAREMDGFFERIVNKHQKLYINVLELFWITSLVKVERSYRYCRTVEYLMGECMCIHNVPYSRLPETKAKLDHITQEMNKILRKLAEKFDRYQGRSDVGVNLVNGFNKEDVPDRSFLSPLDCFHPSAKTQHIAANRLWNGMIKPDTDHPSFANQLDFRCADENTALATWADRLKDEL